MAENIEKADKKSLESKFPVEETSDATLVFNV